MYFYLTGIDYKTAPLGALESVCRSRRRLSGFLAGYKLHETAMLRTCNRIEIYGVASNADEAFTRIKELSRAFPEFYSHAYTKYTEREVFCHALRLASGLESWLQGETAILRQLKSWRQQETFPSALAGLWDEVISLSEGIRQRSGLNLEADNIANIVFHDLNKRISPGVAIRAIVMGTGKIAELIAKYRPSRVSLDFVAHKNYLKAESLARESSGRAFLIKDLPRIINDADVLISATSSPHTLLYKADFASLGGNRERALYVYDLALPRDVEPGVRDIPFVSLQDLSDLSIVIAEYNKRNTEKINLASYLVRESVREYAEVT